MKDSIIVSGIAALVLAILHVFASKIRFLQGIPRSKWLSAAGGIAVAYVFLHVLPELEEWQQTFEKGSSLTFFKHHLYLVALLGLAVFYSLERAAKLFKASEKEQPEDKSYPRIYWLHIISFAIYNALIGYLLIHRDTGGLLSLLFFVVAMGLHFMVNDYGLYEHYRRRYTHSGRWLISLSIIAGWLVGFATEVSEIWLAVIFAFIAGGVILNVLKEELPEERKSNFWAFFVGVVLYSFLLILI